MNTKKKYALITGCNGMDGSYLCEYLLTMNYVIHGTIRRSSLFNTARLNQILDKINLHYADITDLSCLIMILDKIKKSMDTDSILEIYNLAAQSHVQISFELPIYTTNTDAIGTLNILEAIRLSSIKENIRFYQASTSEMFGEVQTVPQTELTPFYPRSPYGVAKLYGYWIVKNYRESYNLHVSSGILFNHSSPRRGENFILRKISLGIAKILNNTEKYIYLGNLNSKRDIGHAKDFVRGMHLILQQDISDDYVLATGIQYTIKEFVEKAFKVVNINIKWKGEGINEVGYDQDDTNKIYIKINPKYFRPCEVHTLLGDYSKANNKFQWTPEITIDELIKEMVLSDCQQLK